ncbi:restriction endonuclease subunit S [Acinetobacter ursingii]|uniref:restriction endonuclease subunit S n=1 Tax=Acinetobacter ursingii TaxID=108980 RepID=UPI00029B1AD6|nr:restriction endonuclease subunit S [Acinetobacter ursingii]ENV74766.1 hypothetical protein F944_02932 [Acinetobacter ursingii DSM 16037 = CIP 107286]MDH2105274.1 restriction endonuclease subunit S [Acinetobacter ursingii]QQT65638.1 restriction endonuclease subunit S [Acinetobacter ursingii]
MSDGWFKTTVGEYSPFVYGKAIKKDNQRTMGIPVYGSNGIYTYSDSALVKQHAVIIGRKGSVGKVHLSAEKCWISDTAFYVIKDSLDESYFVYYLLSSLGLENMNTDAAVPGLNRDNAHRLEIQIPNSIEKRIKLVEPLIKLDKKIHLNNQINQTLESIAQAIFKSWFIDFDPVHAKIVAKQEGKDPELAAMCAMSGKSEAELEQMAKEDFAELKVTAALFPDELVESELGDVPKGWEILDIDKTTSLIIDHRGKTPKKLDGDWSDSGITVLSAKHVKDGCIVNREQLRFVDTELYNKWMKEELEEGDILLTSEGPMGEMYYLASDEKYCLSQRLYALRANTDLVSSAFLYFWLLSPLAKSDMNGRATGTTVVGIRQSELRKVRVLTPPQSICQLFEDTVKANLKSITVNNRGSLDLAQIRDTLLVKLLSGEVDVSDLHGEGV